MFCGLLFILFLWLLVVGIYGWLWVECMLFEKNECYVVIGLLLMLV